MRKTKTARSMSMTAPIGGLNARDSLAAMPPQDAVILDNFFPTPTTVDLRNGYIRWSTGYNDSIDTLMQYNSATVSKIFAASGTSFFDATSSGPVGSAVVSSLSNARWESVNFGTPGGQFLLAVNGVDSPQLYNGTAWQAITATSTPIAITGVTPSVLTNINVFKNRIYFVEKKSFKIWYLAVNSIGGAATSLDLSPLFKLGGSLVAMATWTIDNTAGVQEYAVFLSSEGEIALYEGIDPSDAASWSLVGMFRIGHPVGKRCFTKVGSDLIVICADGFVPLSKVLLTDRSQQQEAISSKIVNLVNDDAKMFGTSFGWQPVLYPIGNKFIINVPVVPGKKQRQYVMNTITGAWCRFTGWNANCFLVAHDKLYFGGNYTDSTNKACVAIADTGFSDAGSVIQGEVKGAFNYYSAPGLLKRFTMVRPIFYTSGDMKAAIAMDVDFDNKQPSSSPSYSNTTGVLWDEGYWDTFYWDGAMAIKKSWQGISGVGYSGAIHMKIVNNAAQVQWMSIDIVYEIGGIL